MALNKQLREVELRVVNIGLELFADALEYYGVSVVHLDWKPPAGGDVRLADLLRRLEDGLENQYKTT